MVRSPMLLFLATKAFSNLRLYQSLAQIADAKSIASIKELLKKREAREEEMLTKLLHMEPIDLHSLD